jgi:hypothetical protein
MKKFFLISIISLAAMAAAGQKYKGDKKQDEKELLNEKYGNSLFRSADGTIFDMENEHVEGYYNILDWLEGRVAGLQVFITRTGIRIPVMRGAVASVYLDDMPINLAFVNMISTYDIGMIKVIKSPFYGAIGNGGGGIIAVYTRKGEET